MSDPTIILSEYDIIIVADASGSMSDDDCPNGQTRWDYMQESVLNIARTSNKIDGDGIGLVIFGGAKISVSDNLKNDAIKAAFAQRSPGGTTPLAEALTAALALAGKSDKKDLVIVFTDGVPDNQAAAADVIRNQANSQATDDACTVLFIQVGKDAAATKYLHSLDDGLTGAKFDIVDAKTIDEVEQFPSIAELLVAAIAD